MKPNPIWDILDPTKISDYQCCPRRYFFLRILGWIPEEPSIHLVHGGSWHKSMRFLLQNKPWDKLVVLKAYQEYESEYRKSFPNPQHDAENHPKQPGSVLKALPLYCNEFVENDKEEIVLHTEIGGTVLIASGSTIHFKMDSILQDSRGFLSREHKTGTRLDDKWKMKWKLSTQIGTYLHVLHCLYPAGEIAGIEINGSFWHKNDTTFFRLLERRRLEAMEAWRTDTMNWISSIATDTYNFQREEDNEVLTSFRRNPEFCTQYFGCMYHPWCSTWANPLHFADEPPLGFKVEHWDPRREELDERISV